MPQADLHQSSSEVPLSVAHIRSHWKGFVALIALWQSRAKQRRQLQELESWALRDLGLSKGEGPGKQQNLFGDPKPK